MPRHSKNNTALGFFTNAERDMLTYGTQQQRVVRIQSSFDPVLTWLIHF